MDNLYLTLSTMFLFNPVEHELDEKLLKTLIKEFGTEDVLDHARKLHESNVNLDWKNYDEVVEQIKRMGIKQKK